MKIIYKGQEARDALKKGIDTVADCIKVTLGPSGRNAVLGRIDITPIITNDGVSIARNIECDNEIEELGAMMVKEASSLTSNKVGDGTTTTTVILQALVSDLFNKLKDNGSLVSKKVNTIKLKKEIDTACDLVVEKLKEKSFKIKPKDIYNVALVSGEYEWIAKLVADIYKQIGTDGYITLQEGIKTGFDVYKGLEINAGYTSEYYINNDKRECVLDNPYVLVTNQMLETSAIVPLVMSLVEKDVKELVIIAPDFSKDLINRLITTKLNAGFTAVALKIPNFGKDDDLIDVATLTGAKFIDKNTFTKYENLVEEIKVENLGKVDKAIITDAKSMFIGGNGDTTERVKLLKDIKDKTESVFDRDRLEKRIAYLSGGIGVITIGANSESERTYFKLKLENAVNAVKQALTEGVVKGGGLTLKEISEEIGETVISKALTAPYKQIQDNIGEETAISDDIVDPVNVTISAVKSACSLAGMVITTEVAVAFKKEKQNARED